jgi:hypothetical protein
MSSSDQIGAGIDAESKFVADFAAEFNKWRKNRAEEPEQNGAGAAEHDKIAELLDKIRSSLSKKTTDT